MKTILNSNALRVSKLQRFVYSLSWSESILFCIYSSDKNVKYAHKSVSNVVHIISYWGQMWSACWLRSGRV